ncbi:MAG: glycosyltransferase [Candidatus Promineifilaceae bacterium]|nr:glycosyltransferase [Candidatus Promineifilaceae bacterium]
MVTACYKPVVNGVTRMIDLYREALTAAGHEVTIFTLGAPNRKGAPEEAGVIHSPGVPLGDSGYYFTLGYSHAAQQALAEMEILHCHHLFMSVEMAHRYGNCPIVYTNHTRYDLYTGAYTPLPQPAADAIMRQIWPGFTDYCDVVITPSQRVREVMRNFGVRRPITVIPNGIEVEQFQNPSAPCGKRDLGLPDDAPLLIYVGRLAEEKNLHHLLSQFALAQELRSDLRLLIVGSGPQEATLREQARVLQIEAAIQFAGAVAPEEVPNLLAAGDVFVTASVSEVHPLSIVEAMAARLPVVAVRSPGIEETVDHGKSGLLVSRPEGLAAAMVALLAQPERRAAMGAWAREASARYDIGETAARTVHLYEELRETRPDLKRKREHGRWLRRGRAELPDFPLVEQLSRLLPVDE